MFGEEASPPSPTRLNPDVVLDLLLPKFRHKQIMYEVVLLSTMKGKKTEKGDAQIGKKEKT